MRGRPSLEPLRNLHLINVSGDDVLSAPLDVIDEALFGDVRLHLLGSLDSANQVRACWKRLI